MSETEQARALGYVAGVPGEPVRWIETLPADLDASLLPGEVAARCDRTQLCPGTLTDAAIFVPATATIGQLRAALWAKAKSQRYMAMMGGCDVPGIGRVQTDTTPQRDSQARIAMEAGRAARAIAAGLSWSIDFTMADNSVRPTTAADMIAIDDAVAAHVQACRAAGEAIRTLIEAAEDEAALAAIDITAGYPPIPA